MGAVGEKGHIRVSQETLPFLIQGILQVVACPGCLAKPHNTKHQS